MSAPQSLLKISGKWAGPNRLWLSPEEPYRESSSTADISGIANEKFIRMCYTWSDKGKPQEGLLLLSENQKDHTVQAVWIDSWHMSDKFMNCQGISDDNGVVSIKGTYPAPPDPDWGWKIVLDPTDAVNFKFLMYNISPDGEEMLAVEAIYNRHVGP